jgi:hypothetical protein
MLGMLRTDGPATATTLAVRLGLNTGATSYHLRQLERHGFVVDDPERGNGRDRWWRAAHQMTTTEIAPPDASAEDLEVLDAYLQSVVVVMAQRLQQSVEELPLLPREWRDATTYSDWVVRLTPRRARRLVDLLVETMNDVEEDEDAEDAGGTAQFVVQLAAFPAPGKVAP